MPTVTCPSCGEKGRIPPTLLGARIKCKACNTSFLVQAPGAAQAPAAAPTAAAPFTPTPVTVRQRSDIIEVDGLDESAWASTTVEASDHEHDAPHAATAEGESSAFAACDPSQPIKQYKLLTPKDKYFEGQFDIDKLEQALNHFARQGWSVRGMATPHVAGFSGGDREQFIILLERG